MVLLQVIAYLGVPEQGWGTVELACFLPELPIACCRHRRLRASNTQARLGLLGTPAPVSAVGGSQQ